MKFVFEWLCANRLSINVTKTEFIIFRPPRKPFNQRIVLKLNGIQIFESPKIKHLGIILDPFRRWNHHINELTKKLNRAIGMLYKIRYNCTKTVLRSLYLKGLSAGLNSAYFGKWRKLNPPKIKNKHIIDVSVYRFIKHFI